MRDDEDDDPGCCYLVVIMFETTEEPLLARLKNHVPIILRTLNDISAPSTKPEPAFKAKDGSAIGFAVRSRLSASRIVSRIHAGDGASPTRTRDSVMAISLGDDFKIERAERLESWIKRNLAL